MFLYNNNKHRERRLVKIWALENDSFFEFSKNVWKHVPDLQEACSFTSKVKSFTSKTA